MTRERENKKQKQQKETSAQNWTKETAGRIRAKHGKGRAKPLLMKRTAIVDFEMLSAAISLRMT